MVGGKTCRNCRKRDTHARCAYTTPGCLMTMPTTCDFQWHCTCSAMPTTYCTAPFTDDAVSRTPGSCARHEMSAIL